MGINKYNSIGKNGGLKSRIQTDEEHVNGWHLTRAAAFCLNKLSAIGHLTIKQKKYLHVHVPLPQR